MIAKMHEKQQQQFYPLQVLVVSKQVLYETTEDGRQYSNQYQIKAS
jgi:hypothetical protein